MKRRGMSVEEVAIALGVSVEVVEEIETRALRKIAAIDPDLVASIESLADIRANPLADQSGHVN